MEYDRNIRWSHASHGLGSIEVFMVPLLQGLGRLDCQLVSDDLRHAQLAPQVLTAPSMTS